MAASYLNLAANTAAHPNPYAADAINNASALNTLAFQTQQQNQLERQYRRDWWKRGLAKGAMGAVSGAISGIAGGPAGIAAGAGAGLAGGFGGEALNHAAFKDQNGALGNAGAALGALGGRAAGSYLGGGPGPGFTSGDVANEAAMGNLNQDDLRMLRAQGLI